MAQFGNDDTINYNSKGIDITIGSSTVCFIFNPAFFGPCTISTSIFISVTSKTNTTDLGSSVS